MADWVALWGSVNAVFLWHIFALMGVVATISPVESTHVMRRQGAETHAIPPLYIRKSGRADIADVYIAGTHLLSAN